MNLYEELCAIAGEENVLRDEPMSRHTTFRIGGPADYFVTPSEAGQIGKITDLCRRQGVDQSPCRRQGIPGSYHTGV